MAERGVARNILSLLLLAGTGIGLYNVYSDNTELKAYAAQTACSERPCEHRITRESRTPLSQSFTFQVELSSTRPGQKPGPPRRASVDVECRRAAWLVGDYRCTAQGALPD